MIQNLALDTVVGLAVCAVVLGLIALYYRHMDASSIDEEAEREVSEETPEERAEALRRQALRDAQAESTGFDSFSQ